MNKKKHRSVYRTPPLVFYREGSHKYIFHILEMCIQKTWVTLVVAVRGTRRWGLRWEAWEV